MIRQLHNAVIEFSSEKMRYPVSTAIFGQFTILSIGACIKLREEGWAIAVETCLKGLAFSFCCNDTHDAGVLRELMKGLYQPTKMPQVVVSKFQVCNICSRFVHLV